MTRSDRAEITIRFTAYFVIAMGIGMHFAFFNLSGWKPWKVGLFVVASVLFALMTYRNPDSIIPKRLRGWQLKALELPPLLFIFVDSIVFATFFVLVGQPHHGPQPMVGTVAFVLLAIFGSIVMRSRWMERKNLGNPKEALNHTGSQ